MAIADSGAAGAPRTRGHGGVCAAAHPGEAARRRSAARAFFVFLFCGVFADLLAPYDGQPISSPLQLADCCGSSQSAVISRAASMRRAALGDHRVPRRGSRPSVSVGVGNVTGYPLGKVDLADAAIRRRLDELPRPHRPDRRRLGVSARACRRSSSRSACCWASAARDRPRRSARYARTCTCTPRSRSAPRPLRTVAPHPAQRQAAAHRLVTTRVGTVILAESGLSFLGLGSAAGPDLGRAAVRHRPHLHVPGPLARGGARAVPDRRRLRHQMFGDALRDLLDPRTRIVPGIAQQAE